MAVDREQFSALLRKVPKITDLELPDLEGRIKWVETQLEEYQKGMYRQVLDLRIAQNYASKEDNDAVKAAENKVLEVTGNAKGIKWSLEALRAELKELKAQRKLAKTPTK